MESTILSELNHVKREQVRNELSRRQLFAMRQSLPVYTLDEIRQFKLPYHEALLINLDEQGYVSTASFIKELIEFQNVNREQAGPSSNVWMRPQLLNTREVLKYLAENLVLSEQFNQRRNYDQECETFLLLAVHFAFLNMDWWWLGEQLLIQSIKVSTEYVFLGGKYEALSRFVYAKFQIENVKEYDTAMNQLNIARQLCEGRAWSARVYFPDAKGTLYMQVCYLNYVCLIREARSAMSVDYEKACKLAVQARRRAIECCDREGETEALLLKGTCEMNMNNAKAAILTFNRALHIQKRLGSQEGICRVRIQLAKAYLMDGNTQWSLKMLMLLKETAEHHNLPFYLAQAYQNLGEYYLNNGEPHKANPLLAESLKIFYEAECSPKEAEHVRILEAISAGLELLPRFVNLIYNSNLAPPEGFQYLIKMVDWKDSRRPFWDEEKGQDQHSFANVIKESFAAIQTLNEAMGEILIAPEESDIDIGEQAGMEEWLATSLIQLHDNKLRFNEDISTVELVSRDEPKIVIGLDNVQKLEDEYTGMDDESASADL